MDHDNVILDMEMTCSHWLCCDRAHLCFHYLDFSRFFYEYKIKYHEEEAHLVKMSWKSIILLFLNCRIFTEIEANQHTWIEAA